MTTRFHELTRSMATLAGLCAIAGAGLTASCFSERATATAAVCDGSAGPCIVQIRNFAFDPVELRVTAGTTVRWVNNDQQAHTSTSDASPALWDSPLLQPGESFSRTFPSVGQFPYHCDPHPTMKATIVVE